MMERALKERIIGAAVLVIVVVLIVPVFLDGPEENEVVSTTVPLPGQSNQEMRTVVLDRDRTDPVPAAIINGNNPAAAAPKPTVVATNDKPKVVVEAKVEQDRATATPPPAQEAKPATSAPAQSNTTTGSSATGMWAVQLGSFSDQKNADRLAADLRKQGFAAFLITLQTDSGELHRVRIGPQKDRASADAMAERLGKAGHPGKVLPHP
jgi:DedD protein